MKKEKYTKPTLDAVELSDDIILASGCVDVIPPCEVVCLSVGDDCPNYAGPGCPDLMW